MFILQYLPDSLILWFCNGLLLAGIALTVTAFFIRSIPLINQYRIPAQVLGIALLVLGVYLRGGLAVEQVWRERVAELEAQIVVAQAASKKVNVQIETRVLKKTEYITRRGQDIVQYVDREVVKYDTKFAPGGVCEIPQEFITAHNLAAEQVK
jgi:hypothetical protein